MHKSAGLSKVPGLILAKVICGVRKSIQPLNAPALLLDPLSHLNGEKTSHGNKAEVTADELIV